MTVPGADRERHTWLRQRGAAEPAESAELRYKAFIGGELGLNPAVRYAILIIEKGRPQKRPTLNINNLNLYVRPAVTIAVVAAVSVP